MVMDLQRASWSGNGRNDPKVVMLNNVILRKSRRGEHFRAEMRLVAVALTEGGKLHILTRHETGQQFALEIPAEELGKWGLVVAQKGK
jgi:hypothetical protein